MTASPFRLADELYRYRWVYLGLLISFAIWGWVDVIPRGMVNRAHINEHRTDFTVYTEAGAAFFDGRDPYEVSNPRGWRYLYPPMFAILVAPLHALRPMGQVAVWFVLSVAMLFGCYFELRRIVDSVLWRRVNVSDRSRLRLWICAAAVGTALLPAFNCLQRGQVEIFKLYLLMLGFRLALTGTRAGAWILAGVVFALAGILKLTPLLPVGCLLLYEARVAWDHRQAPGAWRRPVSLTAGLGSGLLLFALFIPAALTGWNGNIRHLHTWFSKVVTKVVDVRTSDFGEDVRTVRNQSLDNAAYRMGNFLNWAFVGGPDDTLIDHPHDKFLRLPMDDPTAGELIVISRVLALVMLLLFVARASSGNETMGRSTVFGLACVATLVVCPVARACYYVLFLPAIPFVCGWLLQSNQPRWAKLLAWLPVPLVWSQYIFLPTSGRMGLLGLGTTAWFLASCILLERVTAKERNVVPNLVTAPERPSPTREPLAAAI